MPIHKAMETVKNLIHEDPVHVRVEDARLRKWFGKNSNAKKQGAGSVKRDSKIWNDFLEDLKNQSDGLLSYQMVAPKHVRTKLTAETFKRLTGIQGRTNEHGRDAWMLIHSYKHHDKL